MKGQVIFYWIFSLIMVFVLGLMYIVFVPFFQTELGEIVRNVTITGTPVNKTSDRALGVIDNTIMAVSTGIIVCIVLFILFALVASQKREDQVNVY